MLPDRGSHLEKPGALLYRVFVEISLSAHILSNNGATLSMETIGLFVN